MKKEEKFSQYILHTKFYFDQTDIFKIFVEMAY